MPDAAPERWLPATPGAAPRTRPALPKLQSLYDRNLFLQAFQETSSYWNPATRLDDLSTDELILGIRLSARLGGSRLARWLSRAAMARDGNNPRVRYFTRHLVRRGWRLFDDFRAMEATPELKGADPETQANWLAHSAVLWASIRDFERAHDCIQRARSWHKDESWVLSCESDVLGMEDRWAEALASAELSWEISPGTPYAARSLAGGLLNLRRARDAAERLAAAAVPSESFELPMLACWYLCAHAETCAGDERARVLQRAGELADRMPELAPLKDRETRALFARTRLDIAHLADDHAVMELWAKEARSPFHHTVLKNLLGNPTGVRIRLPFRHAIQKHNECLPTSIGSALAAMGVNIDVDAMAAEITFGGTPEWAAADWLEKRGLKVRFFLATPEVSASLIKAGFAFVVTLDYDASGHAVAVVGLDEAAGTLMVHDPQGFRCSEYLMGALGKQEAPLGPQAMAAVVPEKVALLDSLLPAVEAEIMAARTARRREVLLHGPGRARPAVARLAAQHPSHPVTRLVQAVQDHEDGHIGAALAQFQNLLKEFPAAAVVRANLLSCCRSLGNIATMREILADVVERGMLPGVQSQQDWMYPPSVYVTEYADLLRGSAQTLDKSQKMLHALLRRNSACAPAWHVLGDLLWSQRDSEGALLGYRISAYLDDRNEHYALTYGNALGRVGGEEDGLEWLAQRVRRFGASSHAVATWVTWINALEQWGRPERALAAAQESLTRHQNSAELLAFLVPFFARMGKWAEAEERLSPLERAGNAALFRQASVAYYEMRGELAKAVENAEAWLREAPLSMRVRRELMDLLAKRDGAPAAVERAKSWLEEYPAHDEMEELYCRQLDRISYTSWRKYSVVLRRVKRNPEDSWAWRELAFCAMYDFEMAGEKRQQRLATRISRFLDQCSRSAPGDAATLRARAQWAEARGEWQQAVEQWLEAIGHDPASMYACRRAWECASRLTHEERLKVWTRIEATLLRQPGHSRVAQDMLILTAVRFGVTLAEEAASRWSKVRHDDPEIVEAHVDLLLNQGHGRTDDERALELAARGLERFPFQAGLRFSQATALRKLGRFQEAEEVLSEIIRRHPDNSAAQVQLAWVHYRHGRTEEALHGLEAATAPDPQNVLLPRAHVEILIAANRMPEAREMIRRQTQRLPADVGWRQSAIKLLLDCGDPASAVQTARDGVLKHPQGAYLWLLLGRTLSQMRRFAGQGEIESCLRRSLALNEGLFEAADHLAMLLAEQRRYDDAEEILLRVERRLGDPSPARGRVAWLHRQKGQKREALEEMIAIVRQSPWYEWGWKVLLGWIVEDKSWDNARTLLAQVPPELRTNTQIRQQRLEVLERAGLPANALDEEWNSLLHDFPEDLSLHLLRYDSLSEGDRWSEAASVLEKIAVAYPNSPFVLGRRVQVLSRNQQKEGAVDTLMEILFAETEPSSWPAQFAWEAIKKSQYAEEAYMKARSLLAQGRRPTENAISILAGYAMERVGSVREGPQLFLRQWLPGPGALEVMNLIGIIKAGPHGQQIRVSGLLQVLSDFGYQRLVVRFWRKNMREVEEDIGAWSETVRALVGLRCGRQARRLMAGWRERKGVGMWVVANYVICCSGVSSRHLKEVRSSCSDALAGLPHDHCARYLAYRLAESCALLGDQDGFRDTWKRYQAYFDGKLEKVEFFEERQKYLMADLPAMARLLESNQTGLYRKKVRSLRWEGFFSARRAPVSNKPANFQWWWVIVVLWILTQSFRSC